MLCKGIVRPCANAAWELGSSLLQTQRNRERSWKGWQEWSKVWNEFLVKNAKQIKTLQAQKDVFEEDMMGAYEALVAWSVYDPITHRLFWWKD